MKNLNDIDKAAFEQAIRAHGAIVSRICFYYSNGREEYEDLRQDSLLNLWRGWKSFREDCALSTWIYRVTLNTCISQLRSSKRNPVVTASELPELPSQGDDNPELLRQMHALIGKLPPREKAVVLMWLDEMPYEEIAGVMGATRNTVATWIRRAKEKLVKMSNE